MTEFNAFGCLEFELRHMNDKGMSGVETLLLRVDNLKCGGCESTVRRVVAEVEGVLEVEASAVDGTVKLSHIPSEGLKAAVIKKLSKAGYPPQGESDILQKAVSYISCAKGRLSN
jgi:copper chaperone CopZ